MSRAPGLDRNELASAAAVWHNSACAAQDSPIGFGFGKSGIHPRSGGKGSHRKFVHSKFRGFVLVSGHDADDAQHYQEKQLRNALRQIQS